MSRLLAVWSWLGTRIMVQSGKTKRLFNKRAFCIVQPSWPRELSQDRTQWAVSWLTQLQEPQQSARQWPWVQSKRGDGNPQYIYWPQWRICLLVPCHVKKFFPSCFISYSVLREDIGISPLTHFPSLIY